jgi:mannitol-1-phosphate/altronate dehydrogenase
MTLVLNKASLAELAKRNDILLPQYDLDKVETGIVHFGPSNFARAHLAVFADNLLAQGHMNCGIVAVSPKVNRALDRDESPTITRQRILAAQDFLYSVFEKGEHSESLRVIGSIRDLIVGPDNVERVIDLMAAPSTHLVTMTVTQNGYYYSPDQGIDFNHPDVSASLKDSPRITVDYIVRALEKRMQTGLDSFGVMSLDNIENNSDKLRSTVLAYAAIRSRTLRDWIANNTPFYNTMVDRIVPKLDQAVKDEIESRFSLRDQWPLMTELMPNPALIIEQRAGLPSLRIPFHEAGAMYVEHVAPFELAKLRLLNGLHMALGVTGRLRGETDADKALKDPFLRDFAKNFMKEAAGTLKPIDGFCYESYAQELLARVENPHLRDALARLARNGTEKIKTRFLSPLHDAYAHDLPRDHIVEALASWVKYVSKANPDHNVTKDMPQGFYIEDLKAYETGLVPLSKSLNGDITPILASPIWEGLENNPVFVAEIGQAYKKISGYAPN